jgi:hypothetical protein
MGHQVAKSINRAQSYLIVGGARGTLNTLMGNQVKISLCRMVNALNLIIPTALLTNISYRKKLVSALMSFSVASGTTNFGSTGTLYHKVSRNKYLPVIKANSLNANRKLPVGFYQFFS